MASVSQFDIVLVDYGKESVGSEQFGVRPSVVVQNDKGNRKADTTIVIPMTSNIKKVGQPTHYILRSNKKNGLAHDSMLLGECIRQISVDRVVKQIGKIVDIQSKEGIKDIYLANVGL